MKGAGGESKGLRRYDKENLLWQFTVAIRSDPVGSPKKRGVAVFGSVGRCASRNDSKTELRGRNAPCGGKRKEQLK